MITLEIFTAPLPITAAVLFFGFLFKKTRPLLDRWIRQGIQKASPRFFVFLLIVFLGLASSLITATVAALILVEVISLLKLDKKFETHLVVIACFAIGLGAVLTPIGEPLATIAIAKLQPWPKIHFWYLMQLMGMEIGVAVLALGFLSFFFHGKRTADVLQGEHREESSREILIRSLKVYCFVAGLMLLGELLKPFIDAYLTKISGNILYWVNMISAVLDNATLAAAEVSPAMTPMQIKKLLMGLLIAGGMLIPGNIPNIIAASKLKITSKEWAKLGVPLGLILMLLFFLILEME